MKTRLAILLAVPALAVVTPTYGQVSISGGVQLNVPAPSVQINTPGFGMQINAVGDFYQPLTPYGTWMNYQNYGQCWHPTQVAADWQPYTDGSWQYSDAGWYFNSTEPWGWATCHYGSWAFDPSIGWLWIPGTQWAPAWVTWRTSDDYIGWAPCGPSMSVLAPSLFVFVGVHNFGGTFTPGANVFIRNNRTIINNTRVINNFNRRTVNIDGHQKTIYANTGPNVQHVQQATGRQWTPRPVTDVVRESKSRAPENLRGNENRTPQEQRYNNQQRPNEVIPPPTGREQQRNYNNEEQYRLNQQQQREKQVTPQPAPSERNLPPTGREMTPPSRQQEIKPSQTPTERPAPSERATPGTPTERSQPSERTTPPERNMPPTGRENAPSSQRQQEVRPSQAPQQHAPAQAAPKQEKKDNNQ